MTNYHQLATSVENGEVNPLKAYIELKQDLEALESALKIVQPFAISEADKYKEKSFKAFGAVIEKRSSPATWDYSQCAAYAQAKERLKYIEKIAQMGGGFAADTTEEIGKAIKIDGKTTIAIKLAK